MKQLFSSLLLAYFRTLAQVQLWKIKPRIIGITGSAGKSSTMEAVAAILQEKYKIKVGRKANSESGIPLNILGLNPTSFSLFDWLRLALFAPLKLLTNWERYEFYIVEMGIDSPFPPKNMSYLLSILQPEIGIFTSVDAVHSETFDSLIEGKTPAERRTSLVQLIAAEKGKLIQSLPSNGLAVLSAEHPAILEHSTPTMAEIMTFGTKPPVTVQVDAVSWDTSGTDMVFTTSEEKVTLSLPHYLLPQHYAHTFAAALCVGIHLGISPYLCCKLLEKNFKLPPGRASLFSAINGATILDSSYNASAQPTLDFLELLKHIPAKRKLVLLGDMRELGSVTQIDHERVALAASEVVSAAVLVGPAMQQYVLPILKEHTIPTEWFPNAYKAADYLKTILEKDDLLLVKASQNTLLLEIAIAQLLADPSDQKLLSRRGAFWDSQREKLHS